MQICPNCHHEAPGGLYSHGRCEICDIEESVLHCGCYHDEVVMPKVALTEDQMVRQRAWRDLGNIVDKLSQLPECKEMVRAIDDIRADLFIELPPLIVKKGEESSSIKEWWDNL